MADESYQTLTLVLSDGRRLTYTGRAQIVPGDKAQVVDIVVGTPAELPAGTFWAFSLQAVEPRQK